MDSDYTIRPLRAAEWAAYRDLRLRALAGAPDAYASTLEREQAQDDRRWRDLAASVDGIDDGVVLVAEHQGRLVGCCFVRREDAAPARGRVGAMWVDEAHRQAQLGRRLLDEAERWASLHGIEELSLHVSRGNGRAERLYEGRGYRPTGGTQPLRPGSPVVAVELSKRLAEG